jgi:hypothetical protein
MIVALVPSRDATEYARGSQETPSRTNQSSNEGSREWIANRRESQNVTEDVARKDYSAAAYFLRRVTNTAGQARYGEFQTTGGGTRAFGWLLAAYVSQVVPVTMSPVS